jgi:hypothetical protein
LPTSSAKGRGLSALRGFLLAALLLGLFVAPPATGAPKEVEATAAYREWFGPPPRTDAGQCWAAVAYFPGIGASGSAEKLSALPLFVLEPERIAEKAVRVVVEGYPTKVREFQVPRVFPEGAKLRGLEWDKRTVRVTIAGGTTTPHPLAYQALAWTLAQFGSPSVVVQVEGMPPQGPLQPSSALVEPPPPARLLDVLAPVHPGEKPVEINVLFDRPLTITHFRIQSASGAALPGTAYVSMFDMAVVFKPEDPSAIVPEAPLSISWTVRDKKGTNAAGSRTLPLRLHLHQD